MIGISDFNGFDDKVKYNQINSNFYRIKISLGQVFQRLINFIN